MQRPSSEPVQLVQDPFRALDKISFFNEKVLICSYVSKHEIYSVVLINSSQAPRLQNFFHAIVGIFIFISREIFMLSYV